MRYLQLQSRDSAGSRYLQEKEKERAEKPENLSCREDQLVVFVCRGLWSTVNIDTKLLLFLTDALGLLEDARVIRIC